MIQQVLIRIFAYTSRTAVFLCGICIIGPLVWGILGGKVLPIYQWYTTILGAYGTLKIIGIGIISGIIAKATDPFVDLNESEKKE
jgi:hypothetical protein